jgi:cell division protein FtsI/penicillin-binding protein 2
VTVKSQRLHVTVVLVLILLPAAWTVWLAWRRAGVSSNAPWQQSAIQRRTIVQPSLTGVITDRDGAILAQPVIPKPAPGAAAGRPAMIVSRPAGSIAGVIGAGTKQVFPLGVQGQLAAINRDASPPRFVRLLLGSPELAPRNAPDVRTTLSVSLSRGVDGVLRAYAQTASAVVMEVPSGRLLAVVDVPGTDGLSDRWEDHDGALRSLLPVTLPASTLKVATGEFLLTHGGDVHLKVFCDGRHCWRAHGAVNGLDEAIVESCNRWFIHQAAGVRFQEWRDFLLSLGLAYPAQPGLPAGEIVVATPPGKALPWPYAVGQQVYTSVVGLAAMYGTAVDVEGRRVTPRIIDGVDGRNQPSAQRPVVLPPTVTGQMRKILWVNGRSGTAAVLNRVYVNHDAAGKTGTAQVDDHPNDAVFVAVAPWNHPKWIVAVTLRAGLHGTTAAEASGRILNLVVQEAARRVRGGQYRGRPQATRR